MELTWESAALLLSDYEDWGWLSTAPNATSFVRGWLLSRGVADRGRASTIALDLEEAQFLAISDEHQASVNILRCNGITVEPAPAEQQEKPDDQQGVLFSS